MLRDSANILIPDGVCIMKNGNPRFLEAIATGQARNNVKKNI
jgi:hypothetical protein